MTLRDIIVFYCSGPKIALILSFAVIIQGKEEDGAVLYPCTALLGFWHLENEREWDNEPKANFNSHINFMKYTF